MQLLLLGELGTAGLLLALAKSGTAPTLQISDNAKTRTSIIKYIIRERIKLKFVVIKLPANSYWS